VFYSGRLDLIVLQLQELVEVVPEHEGGFVLDLVECALAPLVAHLDVHAEDLFNPPIIHVNELDGIRSPLPGAAHRVRRIADAVYLLLEGIT
jgi:hypothetical protein